MDLFTFLTLAGAAADAVRSSVDRGDRDDRRPLIISSAPGASDTASALDDLRMRTERLTLVNMALWSLLREKTGLTDQDLEKRIQEIDLSDGKLDGKVTKPIAKCSKCSRVISRRHKRCLYCGAERADVSPFDGVVEPPPGTGPVRSE